MQHLLISLYTSKDHQETANTRDISDNILHVENSKNRKLIGSRLSTTLKNYFCLPTANQRDGNTDQCMEIQQQGQKKCLKRCSYSDSCNFYFKTPSIVCNIKMVCFSFERFSSQHVWETLCLSQQK